MVATTTELSARQIDTRLRAIGKALRGLPEAERRWADPTIPADERERERLAFHYEWDDKVTRFEELAAAYEAGVLSPEQSVQFRELLTLLAVTLPSLLHLSVRVPPANLLRRLSSAAHASPSSAG
jgi:hypothetical protein